MFIRKRLRCKHCAQKQNRKTKEFRSWSNKSGLLCLTLDETDLAPSLTFHNNDLWPIETDRASEVIVSLGLRSSRSKFGTKAFPAIHITRSRVSFALTYLSLTRVFNTYSREFHFLAWSMNAVQAQNTDGKIQDLLNEGPCELAQGWYVAKGKDLMYIPTTSPQLRKTR